MSQGNFRLKNKCKPMKSILLFILVILYTACKPSFTALPLDIKIISQCTTRDEKESPIFTNCAREIKSFDGTYNCSFTLEGLEFDINKRFLFDKEGNLSAYWIYKAEGTLTYTIAELKQDPLFFQHIGDYKKNLRLSDNKRQLISNQYTLDIERIYTKQKLIMTKQHSELLQQNQRIFFEYEF